MIPDPPEQPVPVLGTCHNNTLEHNGRGKHPHQEFDGLFTALSALTPKEDDK